MGGMSVVKTKLSSTNDCITYISNWTSMIEVREGED